MTKHMHRPRFFAPILLLAMLGLSGCGTMGAILGTAVGVMKSSVDVFVEAPDDQVDQPTEMAATQQSAG